MLTHRKVVLAAGIWTLSSCMPRPGEIAPPVDTRTEAVIEVPAGAEAFDIDPDRSAITVLVRRAGPLAQLGHNHVIVSSREDGIAWLGRDLAGCGFEIRLPVTEFVVDDPAARAAAGPDFSGAVSDDARQGTYANMLRQEVLDAAHYPEVVVSATRLGGTWERPIAMARFTLRGATRAIDVPVEIQRGDAMLTARGTLRVRQTDFGITPFSVGGGAVQVADDVEIRFEIVATRR